MAKSVALDLDVMSAAAPVPRAAHVSSIREVRETKAFEEKREPLQVRWPSADIKAAKLASIQQDFDTVSDFMLACFHAYMKGKGVQG